VFFFDRDLGFADEGASMRKPPDAINQRRSARFTGPSSLSAHQIAKASPQIVLRVISSASSSVPFSLELFCWFCTFHEYLSKSNFRCED